MVLPRYSAIKLVMNMPSLASGLSLHASGGHEVGTSRRKILEKCASTLSLLKLWVEAFEFYTRILGSKLPVNSLMTRIASLLPGSGFMTQCLDIWHPPIETLPGEGTQFNLGDIEPAAVFR